MRAHLLFVVAGLSCVGSVGLLAPEGRGDHPEMPSAGRSSSAPGDTRSGSGARITATPSTEAYRNPSFFPLDPPKHPRPHQVRDITMMDNYFSPSILYIPAGMTVRFTNRGRHQHTTTANKLWESGSLRQGESVGLTFTRTGKYYFFCRKHPRQMHGTITVY
jgi:plastocyanin